MAAISIIIPVYNEEQILIPAVRNLVDGLASQPFTYEVILCENGSTDGTLTLARELSGSDSHIRVIHLPIPSYGHALKAGIEHARFDRLVLLNLDLCDLEFLSRATALLDQYDCVVGSKVAPGSQDERPLVRRIITRLFNGFLRLALGFQGSDTHGVKAFRRHRVLPLARACATQAELFDTELVLRGHRNALTWIEIPIMVRECRPARTSIIKRAWRTLPELTTLVVACFRQPNGADEELNAYDCERVSRLAQHFAVDEIVELTMIPRKQVEQYLQRGRVGAAWAVLSLAK
jgi:glycosyltransferase involved in cell wall biosynthesis